MVDVVELGVIWPLDASRQSKLIVSPDLMRMTGAMLHLHQRQFTYFVVDDSSAPVVPSQMAVRTPNSVN
jgi:hypothetical protein